MPKGLAGLAKKTVNEKSSGVGQGQQGKSVEVRLAEPRPGGTLKRTEPAGLRLVDADRLEARQVVDVAAARARGTVPLSKRIFDLVGATLLILGLSPLIIVLLVCSFVVGGKPFYRHRRVGQNGVLFSCLKFRTMVRDADKVLQDLLDSDELIKEEWTRDHKLKDDPRVTAFGRFLRKTSLDELPQLWNVLCGEMSLVGPRPVVPDELVRYGNKVRIFLSARPGITGLWQVSGRNDIDYRRRVALDVCYVRSRCLSLDFYILVKTLPVVFAKAGAY